MMFVQPCKLLIFATTIVLTQSRLAEYLHGGCYRQPNIIPFEPIVLTQAQSNQIAEAKKSGFIDALRANRTLTYQNQQPIITFFTEDQKARVMEAYKDFGGNRSDYGNVLWEPEPSNTPRARRSPVVDVPICPVENIDQVLITAFNADDEPLQIAQFSGFNQWVLRQKCKESMSPQGTLFMNRANILCHTIRRSAFLVVVRLDDDGDVNYGDIAVQEVQVESCSSFVK